MPVKLSSGLRSAMITSYGLQSMMEYGVIRVYTGSPPEDADESPTGAWVASVTQDGVAFNVGSTPGGLRMLSPAPGMLVNSGNWVLKGRAAGVAGWWRFYWNYADPTGFSTFYPRIDGVVGDSLILANPNITASTETSIDAFTLVFPA